MTQIITIRDRRQITIPRNFLSQFGLDVGDQILLKLESDQIKIKPMKTKTVDLLSKIQQVVNESGISEKELQQSGTNVRKELTKQYLD